MIAMSNFAELSALEQSLGKKIFPLHLNWDSAKGELHEEAEAVEDPSFFFTADEYDPHATTQTREIFLIKRDENGYYRGIWVDPSDPYGKALIEGDYDRAFEIADARLEEDPNNPDHHFDKAYALAEMGRNEEAIETYEALLSIDPHNASAINNIGVSLDRLGQTNEAHRTFQKAAQLAPHDILIQANLASSYLGIGNLKAYHDQVERVFSIHPRTIEDRLALHNFKQDTGISNLAEARMLKNDSTTHYGFH